MKNLLFPLVLAVVILVLDIIVPDAIVHTKLEVQRVGACGINGMGTELCDVLFTNGSMQRIKRGPEIGDSVWVDIPAKEATHDPADQAERERLVEAVRRSEAERTHLIQRGASSAEFKAIDRQLWSADSVLASFDAAHKGEG